MDAAKVGKVGMREFRHQFGEYVEAGKPLAITKHGRTVGFYIPVRSKPEEADLASLREAGRVLDALMAERGISEDAVVAEFKRLRQEKKRRG